MITIADIINRAMKVSLKNGERIRLTKEEVLNLLQIFSPSEVEVEWSANYGMIHRINIYFDIVDAPEGATP